MTSPVHTLSWLHARCSSERGRFELVNERFSGRCDEISEPAIDGQLASADRDLRRLRPFLGNILAFAARRFDFEPAGLVFFSCGTPPPVLTG